MIHTPWIRKLFGIDAITLWKWVVYADKNPSDVLINHERIHLDQIKKNGAVKFYCIYLFDYLKLKKSGLPHDLAYRNIRWEKEAYENQENLNYKVGEGVSTS